MKRLLVLLIGTLIFTTNTAKAEEPLDSLFEPPETTLATTLGIEPVEKEKPPKTTKNKRHSVVSGDTLSKIAKKYNTSIKRLFYKNKQIKHPDRISVGQKIVIPKPGEKLKKRSVQQVARNAPRSYPSNTPQGHGNFEWGWCTWFAQSQRPDMKFGGNANEWIRWANSSTPKIGAVAVNTWAAGGYGHVAIVIGIEPGRVKVRHMNYGAFGVVTEDWLDRSYFSGYIL